MLIGTAVSVFKETADEVSFFVDGKGQTQITLDVDLGNGNLTTVKVVTA